MTRLRGLKARLLVLFLSVDLVALAVTIKTVSSSAYEAIEEQIQAQISTGARQVQSELQQDLETKWGWMSNMVDNAIVLGTLRGDARAAATLASFMRELNLPGRGGDQMYVALVSPDGRVRAANRPDAPPIPIAGEPWLARVASGGADKAQIEYRGSTPLVVFALPVFEGSAARGALVAQFDLGFASDIAAGQRSFDVALIAGADRVVSGSVPDAMLKRIGSLAMDPEKPNIFRDGERLYCVVPLRAPLESALEWRLAMSAPLAVVRRPISALRLRLLSAGLAMALLLALVVWWRVRAFVRPVEQLEAAMRDIISRGDLSRRVPVAADDEIGRLARTFNEMLGVLRDSSDRLALLASIPANSPLPIVLTDDRRRVVFWNAAATRLFGWSFEEIAGRPLLDVCVPPDLRETTARRMDAVDAGEGLEVETVRCARDGTAIPVRLVGALCRDHGGRAVGQIQILQDLRDVRRLQEALGRAEKLGAVGQLAAGVAHEINNPLGIILGFAQGLRRRLQQEPDSPWSGPVLSIEREALRCKELVASLLSFSRRSSSTQRARGDLRESVRQALSLVGAQARVKNVSLNADIGDAPLLVVANGNQMQQIVVNLCTNAIDAMAAGGDLTVTLGSVRADGRVWAELRVADTGSGIPESIRAQVFDPFFTTKEVGQGTGLGLALVHEIVGQHNGSIRFESELGKGTTFQVLFPLEAA